MMKKKIFIFTHDYPLNHGDTSFISSEIEALSKAFENVIVLCFSFDDGTSIKIPNNVCVCFLDKISVFKRIVLSVFSICFFKGLSLLAEEIRDFRRSNKALACINDIVRFYLRSVFYCRLLKRTIKTYGKPNVIYSFWSDAELLSSVILSVDSPLCTRIHGYDLFEERRVTLYQPFKKVLDRRLSAVFFISQQGLNYYREKYSTNSKVKYFLSYLGTRSTKNAYNHVLKKMPIQIVSLSSIIPLKRVDLIIDALSLIDENISVNWTHIGGGDDFEQIQLYAKRKLCNKKNIEYFFLGQMDHESVINYLNSNQIHMFINASTTEGLPVSMMEALSNSIPIIGPDIGGISELVDESDGILLHHASTAFDYAAAIEKISFMETDKYDSLRIGAYKKWNNCFNSEYNDREFTRILLDICDL